MAQTSKQKRALRQARRRATIAEKYGDVMVRHLEVLADLQGASAELYQCKALLFALLAQAGGSLEVTKGTQAHVGSSMERLSLASALKEGDAQTLVVTLVEAPEVEQAQAHESAVKITRIADDEPDAP